MMNFFKKETPKEAAMKAKRETRREVRVSCCQVSIYQGGIRRGDVRSGLSVGVLPQSLACC